MLGPRTGERRLRDLSRNGMGLIASFCKYRIDLLATVRASDIQACMEHPLLDFLSFLHEVLEVALVYDQLAVYNCASTEMLIRKSQQIKHTLSLSPVKPTSGNTVLFIGSLLTKEDHVGEELNTYIAERMKAKHKMMK